MKWKIDRNPTCKCYLTLNICGIVTMWTLSSQYVIFRSFESDGESNEKKCLRENISRMKCWITLSHKVSGGRLWLYVVAETFGYTSRCVVVVLLAAYRINAPTNRPAIIKKKSFPSHSDISFRIRRKMSRFILFHVKNLKWYHIHVRCRFKYQISSLEHRIIDVNQNDSFGDCLWAELGLSLGVIL